MYDGDISEEDDGERQGVWLWAGIVPFWGEEDEVWDCAVREVSLQLDVDAFNIPAAFFIELETGDENWREWLYESDLADFMLEKQFVSIPVEEFDRDSVIAAWARGGWVYFLGSGAQHLDWGDPFNGLVLWGHPMRFPDPKVWKLDYRI